MTLAVATENVVPLYVVNGKEVKYNKDGSIKMTRCNKVEGVSSEVFAFRTKEEIKNIFDVLNKRIGEAYTIRKEKDARRNKLIFVMGMNVGLRASDLCTIKWDFFFHEDGTWKDFYIIRPKKTANKNKYVKLFFNEAVRSAVDEYIERYPIGNLDDYVFVGAKGVVKPTFVWKLVTDVSNEAGVKQNVGSHTLRKTFGYWHWRESNDKNQALVILQSLFGHADTRTTMKYIGLIDDEIKSMFYEVNIYG